LSSRVFVLVTLPLSSAHQTEHKLLTKGIKAAYKDRFHVNLGQTPIIAIEVLITMCKVNSEELIVSWLVKKMYFLSELLTLSLLTWRIW